MYMISIFIAFTNMYLKSVYIHSSHLHVLDESTHTSQPMLFAVNFDHCRRKRETNRDFTLHRQLATPPSLTGCHIATPSRLHLDQSGQVLHDILGAELTYNSSTCHMSHDMTWQTVEAHCYRGSVNDKLKEGHCDWNVLFCLMTYLLCLLLLCGSLFHHHITWQHMTAYDITW